MSWWKNPRKNETIGGGYLIFRRGKKTGRVGIGSTLPFEHASLELANKEVKRLKSQHPDEIFQVFKGLTVKV